MKPYPGSSARWPGAIATVLSLVALASCDSGSGYSATPPDTVGDARPATVLRPSDYDPDVAYPLVVLLHGYGVTGAAQDFYFGAGRRVDEKQFLLVLPDGVKDETGSRYWNGGPCCTFGAEPPDDVAYLVGLVDEVARTHHVDRRRVFVLGHSNGGAMAMKLACAAPDRFAAIASLAGIPPERESDCPPSAEAVSVLAMHGTADDVVLYDGTPVQQGIPLVPYPSAPEVARRFASRLGCDTTAASVGAPFDLEDALPGSETTPTRYEMGCHPGSAVELWTIDGGGHLPLLASDAIDRMLDWLFAHGR